MRHVTDHSFRNEAPSGALRRTGAKPTLMFVVPAHGRENLTAICLRQLRRTCDALAPAGVQASAVVIAEDGNLDTARALGFGTVQQSNRFLSQKFNDGIQAACDPELKSPPWGVGRYEVIGPRQYQGFGRGEIFAMRIDRAAEQRAVNRGDIRLLNRVKLTFPDEVTPPAGWDGRPADYVVPFGSDDFADHRLFLNLPGPNEVRGFRMAAFVNEDATEIVSRSIDYDAGVGIRVYPRTLMEALQYRPADEHRERGCDTSILVNVRRTVGQDNVRISYGDLHEWQIVDWKTSGQQLNSFHGITARHRRGSSLTDPFGVLADVFPPVALAEMRAHYSAVREPVAA